MPKTTEDQAARKVALDELVKLLKDPNKNTRLEAARIILEMT